MLYEPGALHLARSLTWSQLPELTPEAAFWIQKAGAEHYAEHLPRLREWVMELRSLT